MAFRTKIDFSDNRQVKQHIETFTLLSGGTIFGTPFNDLPSGPNMTTTGQTNDYVNVVSTFSGNSGTTNYTWYDSAMQAAWGSLSAWTPSNSGQTQVTIAFSPSSTTTIDGNTVNLAYSGIGYDLYVLSMIDLGGGNYSGTVESESVIFYSANTLDFTGRTIWVDVSGMTRTQELIIPKNPQLGYVWTCDDLEGKGKWGPASAVSSSDVWVSGTGVNSAVLNGNSNIALGTGSIAGGVSTSAMTMWSYTEGYQTIASGDTFGGAHAEGYQSRALNRGGHAEGLSTKVFGVAGHAEGNGTIVGVAGRGTHAEGDSTYANGTGAHAEGTSTSATTDGCHAEGGMTIASGYYSHAEGWYTQATNYYSHAEGDYTISSGTSSHAEGTGTIAGGNRSHAGGYQTVASGETSFVHGSASTANGNSTIVLGSGITGNSDNTVYVNKLNIKTLPAGTSINNLGIDINGDVIIGTTGGGGTFSGGTVTGPTNFTAGLTSTTVTATSISSSTLTVSGVTFNKLLLEKSGVVAGASFAGSPKTATVTFATSFPNTNYIIMISGEDERIWTSSGKTSGGFVINSGANTVLTGNVYWYCKQYGEV